MPGCGSDALTNGDGGVGVFVPASRSSWFFAHMMRPSTFLLLNKPVSKPCIRHFFAAHSSADPELDHMNEDFD